MELNQKILDRFIDKSIFLKAGKLLGIVKNNTLIFDYESESHILMDFAINEIKNGGKNAIELYLEKVKQISPIENEILLAQSNAYTSLFDIIDTHPKKNKLYLIDLLSENNNQIELIDIGFSATATTDQFLFTRIVPYPDMNITGGIGFPFLKDEQDYILKEYRVIARRVKSSSLEIKKYVAFYKLYKRCGIETHFV